MGLLVAYLRAVQVHEGVIPMELIETNKHRMLHGPNGGGWASTTERQAIVHQLFIDGVIDGSRGSPELMDSVRKRLLRLDIPSKKF